MQDIDPFITKMFEYLELTKEEIDAFTNRPTREPDAAHTPNPAPPQTLSSTATAC